VIANPVNSSDVSSQMWSCSKCSFQNDESLISCIACWEPIEHVSCEKCKELNPITSKYCSSCFHRPGVVPVTISTATAGEANFVEVDEQPGKRKRKAATAAAAAVVKEVAEDFEVPASNISANLNYSDRAKLFSLDVDDLWDSGSFAYHNQASQIPWIEFLVPDECRLNDLAIQMNTVGDNFPLKMKISVAAKHIVTHPSYCYVAPKVCDANCSTPHAADDLCINCGRFYSLHNYTHNCGVGNQGSFATAAQLRFSTKIPAANMIELRELEFTGRRKKKEWVPVVTAEEAVQHQVGLVRIEILSVKKGFYKAFKVGKFLATVFQDSTTRPPTPPAGTTATAASKNFALGWRCKLCYEVNTTANRTSKCEVRQFQTIFEMLFFSSQLF
jgi:hypothetical protein